MEVITYLPVVARDGTRDGGHGCIVVETLHVFIADLRDRRGAAIVGSLSKCSADIPGIIGRTHTQVDLGWRLAARLLCLSQSRGDADGSAWLVDALMAGEGQLCIPRRSGGDVGGHVCRRARRRVLCGFAVGMVVIWSVLGDRSRGGEGGSHGDGGRVRAETVV